MLRYEYINRAWIVSATARRIYRLSAGASMMFFVFWMTILIQWPIPEKLESLVRLFLLLGILGAGITLVGMEYFLFRFDESSALKQIFWFCVMLFPILGAALYCFIVYSRSEVLKKSCIPKAGNHAEPHSET